MLPLLIIQAGPFDLRNALNCATYCQNMVIIGNRCHYAENWKFYKNRWVPDKLYPKVKV
jgi:hypothetical protein